MNQVGQQDIACARILDSYPEFTMISQISLYQLCPCWTKVDLSQAPQRIVQLSELNFLPVCSGGAKVQIFESNVRIVSSFCSPSTEFQLPLQDFVHSRLHTLVPR